MSSAPSLMRVAMADAHGEALRLVQIATPRPKPGQVLVRVIASGLNPLDLKILAGSAAHARHPLPNILGIDMAGVVVEAGPEVTRLQPGDAVFGMAGGVGGHPGSLAEYVVVDARLLARKPINLTMRAAAAVPLAFITAWEGLVDRAAVSAGHQVLVRGGAGGVGQMALQIAKARGATTSATGSASARAVIERLGATYVDKIEASDEVVARITGGQGFDIIFDTGGGASLDAAFAMVRRFGHVVSALGWGVHLLAPLSFRAASYSGIFTLLPLLTGEGGEHHGEILDQATALIEAGELAPNLDPRHFTIDTAQNAYNALEAGQLAGKLVVDVTEEAGM